jgi:WD40 repeat protein
MKVAELALEEGNRGLAVSLVNKYLHPTGNEDLRGFEWRYLWERCQGKEQFTLAGHSNRVTALAFSPDKKVLFSGGSDGVIKVWDLALRKELLESRIGNEWIENMAISPTGNALFVGWFTGVAILDGPSFASEKRLDGAKFPLALSPDGQTMLTGGTNGIIIWDAAHAQRLHTLRLTDGAFAFSPDSTVVAVATGTGDRIEIKLWNVSSLRAKGDLAQPLFVLQQDANNLAGFMNVLAFSRDGQLLAAGHEHGLQLWDAKGGLPLGKLQLSEPWVRGIAFLPDGKTMVTHTYQQDFRVWDISVGTNIVPIGVINAHLNEIGALALTADGRQLASSSKDGTIKLWNADAFEERPVLKNQIEAAGIGQFWFSKDGHTIFTMSLNSSLGIWEAGTLQPLASYALPTDVRLAVMSPQGNQLAVGLTNGAVQVWDALDRQRPPQFRRELSSPQAKVAQPLFSWNNQVYAFPLMTWSGDGKRLAAVLDGVCVWDVTTGQTIRRLSLRAKPLSIALSPDGRILAAGLDLSARARNHFAAGVSQNVELWDLTTGKVSFCAGHQDIIVELAFSPDGTTLATASYDNTVGLWQVPTGKAKFRFTSHLLAVDHLTFSPDGRTLATRGGDGTLRLWNVAMGRELMTFKLSDFGPESVGTRFSPDGTTLAIGVVSPPQIKFIRAPTLADIEAAEARKNSN